MKIGPHTFDEYIEVARKFHGSPAPGLILGGIMVEKAMRLMPEGVLYDAISETKSCLPDAVQLLTPCTYGNSWLKVINLGRYAVTLYNKFEGDGFRVYVDADKLAAWPEIKAWLMKEKSKKEQPLDVLLAEIRSGGEHVLSVEPVKVRERVYRKMGKGKIALCPVCGEPYPVRDGGVCRGCQGESPYETDPNGAHRRLDETHALAQPAFLDTVKAEAAASAGVSAAHDMTRIVPGESKGVAVEFGQEITAGDVCDMQRMGKFNVYVEREGVDKSGFIHENDVAKAFATAMSGPGVGFVAQAREGKINMTATAPGLFQADVLRMKAFNMIPGVMVASRHTNYVVEEGFSLAGTRAIPLYLPRPVFERAMHILEDGPLFEVKPMRKAKIGILVTGTEVFQGIIEDKFVPIISAKAERLECPVVAALKAPDDAVMIRDGVRSLLEAGAEIIVTTAGLSVDPDDVTRQGLLDAGLEDMLYGAPVLPGAMTLVGRIGGTRVIGVPACGLFFKTTSFDILFPRLLADLPITRADLAAIGHGGMCLECRSCVYPKCGFGKAGV